MVNPSSKQEAAIEYSLPCLLRVSPTPQNMFSLKAGIVDAPVGYITIPVSRSAGSTVRKPVWKDVETFRDSATASSASSAGGGGGGGGGIGDFLSEWGEQQQQQQPPPQILVGVGVQVRRNCCCCCCCFRLLSAKYETSGGWWVVPDVFVVTLRQLRVTLR